MARWLAENSMLTQRGIEILNKLKAGNGKITITKVVAGSGRVSSSQLFSLLNVSGAQKPMVITNKTTDASGSEISLTIQNDNFDSTFTLQQIGVYVTHPDYAGEQLYHISQCEAEGADVIPPASETPTTLGYSLFLEHGNSSSVEITIDPQGMLRRDEFTAFKGIIPKGNLVVVDEQGNLKDAGKSASELCNPNLLTNAYFPSPVNRKNGFVVPPSTPYYSNTGLSTQAGTTATYVRVTKVSDVYGTITLNNVVYYVSWSKSIKGYANSGISIDRWKLTSQPNSYILVENDGVVFGSINASAEEYIQHNTMFNPADAVGRYLTLSVLTTDGRFFTTTTKSVYDGSSNWGLANVGADGVRAYIASNGTNFFGIQMTISIKSQLKIKAMKLEFGTQQTLAHQDSSGNWILNEIPDFAEEMAKCVQYNLNADDYLGGVPYGYVEEEITLVQSAEDLDARLNNVFANMASGKCKFTRVTFSVAHPVLGGGSRLLQIFKDGDNFGVVKSFSYANNSNGIILEHSRSKYDGVWTPWAKTYNTYSKPTPAEIGAFGALPHTSVIDLNNFTSLSSVSVSGAKNKPAGTSDYGLAWNIVGADPAYLVQNYLDALSKKVYQRFRIDSVWYPWEMGSTTTVVPASVE